MNRYSTNSKGHPEETITVSGAVRFTSVRTQTVLQGAVRYRSGAQAEYGYGMESRGGTISRSGDIASVRWGHPPNITDLFPLTEGSPTISAAVITSEREAGEGTITLCSVAPVRIGTFSVSVTDFPRFGRVSYPAISF